VKSLKLFLMLAAMFIATMGCLMYMQGCSDQKENPLISENQSDSSSLGILPKVTGPAWENNVLSEACYALSQSRSGYSNLNWNGYAMGDWPYPWQGDCCGALAKVTKEMYGANTGGRGSLGLWQGLYQQGGECKFFVNLILYRCSYGFPGGHLMLPGGSYYYTSPKNWRDAQPGYIIQSASMPHTAIVIANYGSSGLSVIDANWIGGRYSYAIGRHVIPPSTLDQKGFLAYRPTDACNLVN